MLEFTGERVVPGEVEPDLWNEHVSRYHFAARFAGSRHVADLGCGAGYGSAILARAAAQVDGFDLSAEAVAWATEHYPLANVRFSVADCARVPLEDGAAGLVVAFELIEHLAQPEGLLREARRILASDGLFLISTPNAAYYAESRGASGPNPFHAREYDLAEFRGLLALFFPHVEILGQSHSPAICIQSMEDNRPGDARIETLASGHAHFFVAVCSPGPLPEIAPFVYVPQAGNVLREREEHIARLQQELEQKQAWLDRSLAEHSALVDAHRRLQEQLEQANAWAQARDAELTEKTAHVERLLEEVREHEATVTAMTRRLEAVEADLLERTQWALGLEAELRAKSSDLLRTLEALQTAEAERDERTRWALSLDARCQALEAQLSAAIQSRWLRLGRFVGLGPKLAP